MERLSWFISFDPMMHDTFDHFQHGGVISYHLHMAIIVSAGESVVFAHMLFGIHILSFFGSGAKFDDTYQPICASNEWGRRV